MKKKQPLLSVALCGAFLVSVLFYLLAHEAGDGRMTLREFDAPLYLQYARNLAAGQPFTFLPGDPPSTGCTGLLYPALMAPFFLVGLENETIFRLGFLLNTLFLLGTVGLTWKIARRLCPPAAGPATLLAALSGPLASVFLGQTDMGLFALLILSAFYAALAARSILFTSCMALAALAHPQGALFAFAALLIALAGRWLPAAGSNPKSRQTMRRLLWGGATGLLLTGGILLLNRFLTGQFVFHSIANKSYLHRFPPAGAVVHAVSDALTLFKEFFFGLTGDFPREYATLPLLGGVFGLTGLLLRPRHPGRSVIAELWLALSALIVIAAVSASSWQGVSNDRYLVWMIPLWTLYGCIGILETGRRLHLHWFAPMLLSLLFVFQLITLPVFASVYYTGCVLFRKTETFVSSFHRELPPNQILGCQGDSAWTFFMPGRTLYNLSGITSPDFFFKGIQSPLPALEQIKHRPDLRFDTWLLSGSSKNSRFIQPFKGRLLFSDTDSALSDNTGFELWTTDWSALAHPAGQLPQHPPAGKTLTGRLDVGHQPDETAHRYRARTRLKNNRFGFCLLTFDLDGAPFTEVARPIIGSEQFTVPVDPNRDLTVVLRTARTGIADVFNFTNEYRGRRIEFEKTINLHVYADGVELDPLQIPLNETGWTEAVFTIPASALQRDRVELRLVGDHFSCGFWFYQ